MSPPSEPSTTRPRPLAEVGLDALGECAEELARRWAIALIRARPPQDIGAVPLGRIADDGPALCAQAVSALGSDGELDRLTGAGPPTGRERTAPARSLAAIAGAGDPAAAAAAVEALRGVLWQALLGELSSPAPPGVGALRQLSDASERLACVCAEMLAAALTHGSFTAAADTAADAAEPEPAAGEGGAPAPAQAAPGPRTAATIVDERPEPLPPGPPPPASAPGGSESASAAPAGPESAGSESAGAEQPLAGGPALRRQYVERSPERPWASREAAPLARALARSRPDPGSGPAAPGTDAPDEIAIRDARGEEGPTAWIGTIGKQLQRLEQDGLPFAVLLVEPPESVPLRSAARTVELMQLAGELEDALSLALGVAPPELAVRGARGRAPWSGSLTRERAGRYWLISPETDRVGAQRLAERLMRAVSSVVEYRGEPVRLLIGTAVCPDDGSTAAALAAHADLDLYAARTASRSSLGSGAAPEKPA